MDSPESIRPSAGERLRRAWHSARLWLIFIFGLVGIVVVISLPQSQGDSTFVLEVGDVAPQDIRAPYALSYSSTVLTEAARQKAANEVSDIYDPPDSNVARQQIERLRAALDFIDTIRADQNASMEQKVTDLTSMLDIELSEEEALSLLNLSDSRWEAVKLETTSVLEQVMRSEIREGRVEEARRRVPALVSISLPQSQSSLVSHLAAAFVAPNALLNHEATEAAKALARQIDPVSKSYADGETIISRGDLVTALHIEGLQAFGLLKPPGRWQTIAIRAMLVVLLGSVLTVYANRVHKTQIRSVRLATVLSLLFITLALAMQLMIPNQAVLPYVFPAATVPMLLSVLFSPGMGIMSAMVIGALAGFMAPRGLELGIYTMVSATMAALVIERAERLSSFFWSGLAAALSAATIIIIFRFPDPATDLLGKVTLLGAAALSGLLSASLAFGLLLLVGNLLGMTTSLQLIELSRPDHPLLQMVLRNAPGTYQHSLQVANLVEQAARAIDANALLSRVGSLYHDAGKALRPQFFIENQVPGQNVHEQLDPKTSASLIIGHVRDGLDLARKHRIPQRIQDFISEHHGTLQTSYQYRAALKAADGDENRIDPTDFVYPGPKPRSRETALLMLADGVEAKARADTPDNEDEIDKLVRWVIEDRLAKRQLDRTDLTLRDLDTIRRSFVSTLKNIYHPRLRYPETEVEGESHDLAKIRQPKLPSSSEE